MTTKRAPSRLRKTYCRVDGGTMVRTWVARSDIERLQRLAEACEDMFSMKPSVAVLLRAGLKLLDEKLTAAAGARP